MDAVTARIASRHLITCRPQDSLQRVSMRMKEAQCGSVIIMDDQSVLGIWTDSDVLKLEYDDKMASLSIGQVMSSPVYSVSKYADLTELEQLFNGKNIRHCLVTNDDGSPYGLVSKSDLVHALAIEVYLRVCSVERTHLIQLPVIPSDITIRQAKQTLQANGTEAAVVLGDAGKPTWMLSKRDLAYVLAQEHIETPIAELDLARIVSISSSANALDALRLLKESRLGYLQVTDKQGGSLGFVSLQAIHRLLELEYISHLKTSLEGNSRELETSNKHLQLANRVIESSLNSIMITDAMGCIVSVNPAFERVTGYKEAEIVGETPAILKSGLHDDGFYRNMYRQLAEKGEFEGEIWNRRKDGQIYAEHLTIRAIYDAEGQIYRYASIFNDITKQKVMEEENLRLSLTDALTGLPNRRTFMDRLELALEQATRHDYKLAVLCISLDHYRQLSNTLGHTVGDAILMQFSTRLLGIVRKEDCVARLGEEEFAILLPQIDDFDGTQRVINAIIDFSRHSFVIEKREIFLTTSTGVSFYPGESNAETLLNQAETAMQQAKEGGPNSYRFFTSDMDEKSRRQLDMQTLLRSGLHREEFCLHYQPKICLRTENLVAQEALIRWTNDQMGSVPPSTFVPIVEKLGLIEDLSRWVIREACRQNKEWMAQSVPVNRMSVNISPIHLRRGNLLGDIQVILEELEYSPEHLDLEITESAFLDNSRELSHTLKHLRDMGVSISIDDFGTGYSSLSYLKMIPADTIKIDASFIREIVSSREDQKITQAIISMAHHLGFEVIAEGVEDARQLEILRDFGCDQVQGFFYSHPLPADEYLNHTQNVSLQIPAG
ncbi:MAG: EAL domain-containing protein [Pseudomonadales bacterium]|nr:EAL domain-containing protein [Pseudomonadales bacterium]